MAELFTCRCQRIVIKMLHRHSLTSPSDLTVVCTLFYIISAPSSVFVISVCARERASFSFIYAPLHTNKSICFITSNFHGSFTLAWRQYVHKGASLRVIGYPKEEGVSTTAMTNMAMCIFWKREKQMQWWSWCNYQILEVGEFLSLV